MSYLQTIEFLVKEVAKKDQEIKSLSIALDSKSTLVKELSELSDKRLEALVAKRDESEDMIEDLEATLESLEARLSKMTEEKEFWRIDAMDWVDNREPKWRAEKKQYEAEIEELKTSIVSINQDRIKVIGEIKDKYERRLSNLSDVITRSDAVYEAKIAELQLEINHLKNNK